MVGRSIITSHRYSILIELIALILLTLLIGLIWLIGLS